MNKFSRVDDGFTLIEMLVVVVITGILASIAVPSLISQKKPMRSAVIQVESMIKTVNLVARANSGNPYRIRPVYDSVKDQYHFRVEVRRNSVCSNDSTASGWFGDTNKFVYLPPGIVIKDALNVNEVKDLTVADRNAMTTCFDSRGMESNGGRIFNLADTKDDSKVSRAEVAVSAVGDVSRKTFNKNDGRLDNDSLS